MVFWGLARLPLRRFYMYILKRLIGSFLRRDIDLEQLDVQLYRGIVQLKLLELDVAQLNLAVLGGGLLFHFASALIGCIKMDIPWRHLLRDHCKVYISGVDCVLARGAPQGLSRPPTATVPAAPSATEYAGGTRSGVDVPEQIGRYSDDGIDTLSRLVKLVMSRMELCIDEASFSLQAPPADRLLRARVASIVVFSEQPVDGGEERTAHVAGASLALVPRAPLAGEPLLLAETDPGDLRLRKGPRSASTAGHGPGSGMRLDVELSLSVVRFVVSPGPWRALCELLVAMKGVDTGEIGGMQASNRVPAGQECSLEEDPSSQQPIDMFQSLLESSSQGNHSQEVFWHDIYRLFEADAQLEDVAAQSELPPELDEEDSAEDAAGLQEASGRLPEGPLQGCTVRLAVADVVGVLVLGETLRGMTPLPNDVPVQPGPAPTVHRDHAQMCLRDMTATFERPQVPTASGVACPPAATVLVRSLDVHLHRRCSCDVEDLLEADEQPMGGSGDGNGEFESRAARSAPEEFIIHSMREAASSSLGPCPARMVASETDPMFCSVYSRAVPEDEDERHVALTPEPGSCRCSTTESVGDSGSEDSFLQSPAAARSMDESSEVQAQRRSRTDSGAHPGAASSASAVPEVREMPPQDELSPSAAMAAALGAQPRIVAAPEEAEEEDSQEDEQSVSDEDDDDDDDSEQATLEQLFFDRSRPMRETLLGRPRATHERPVGFEPSGNSTSSTCPAWVDSGNDFLSKCVLYMVPPGGQPSQPNDTGSTSETPPREPPLTLPPVGHPLWNRLRLVEGGSLGAAVPAGHQIYVEWVDASGDPSSSQAAVAVECLPVIISLCADSVHVLTRGTSWMTVGSVAPSSEREPRSTASASGQRHRCDHGPSRKRPPTFKLVGLAPVVRIEMSLGTTQLGDTCLVSDFLIPRVFGMPQSDWARNSIIGRQLAGQPQRDQRYDESLHLELADMRVFLLCRADGSDRWSAPTAGSTSSCMSILSVTHANGRAAPHNARLSCSIFCRNPHAPNATPAPILQTPEGPPPSSATTETTQPGVRSEWTKISEVQAAAESRSSLVLQDLRQASHRLLRPGHSQPSASRRSSASVPPRLREREEALEATAPDTIFEAEPGCSQPGEQAQEANVELDLSIPGTLQLQGHSTELQLLQEALLSFASQLSCREEELRKRTPCRNTTTESDTHTDLEMGQPALGCTLTMGSLSLRLLDASDLQEDMGEDEEEANRVVHDEELQLTVSPVSCRLLKSSGPEFKIRCAGKEVRLEDRGARLHAPQILLQPWYQSLVHRGPVPSGATSSSSRADSAYPCAAYPRELKRALVSPAVLGSDLGCSNNGHYSLCLQFWRGRQAGTERINLSTKASNLLVNAHRRLLPAYLRLAAFLRSLGGAQHQTARAAPKGPVLDCQVSLLDCLVDFPSDAFSEASLPAAASTGIELEGEQWRTVVHVDGVDLTLLGTEAQSAKVWVRESNVFLVDRPIHLSRLNITSPLPQPTQHLLGLGFARILTAKGASATWVKHGGPMVHERSQQTLDVVLGDLSGRACADAVKCLLCVSMEVAEKFASAAGLQPAESLRRAATETEADELEVLQSQADPGLDVNILENIDMFAFGPGGDPPPAGGLSRFSSSPSELQLEGIMIDDYIRAQEQQQSPRAPVRAHGAGDGETEEAPTSVAVCLFDLEACPEEQLRELYAEDRSARHEVELLLTGEADEEEKPSEPVRLEPSLETVPSREVLQQDGTAVVWFVDPDTVQLVEDHFAPFREPKEEPKRAVPARAPPVRLQVSLQCRSARLSLEAGADFEDRSHGRQRAQPARHTNHLTLQLQHTVANVMLFETTGATQLPRANTLQRRFAIGVKDFCVLDHVQTSVFSHVLSYFEDKDRPRPSHADMLRLVVDELSPSAGGDALEYKVEFRLLPLQLTVDQDAVDFLLEFVQLCTLPTYVEEDPLETTPASHAGDPEVFPDASRSPVVKVGVAATGAPSGLMVRDPFFQQVSVGPLLLSVDYRAKRLDVDALRRGELWELVNLLPLLEGLQIAFRSVQVHCVTGTNQLVTQVVNSWSTDLNRTQILRSLMGVTPVRSFANIGGGLAEMVLEPLKQYRKGGGKQRISRTLLRGVVSFLKHVTVESIDLTERIFVGAQSTLEYMNTCLQEHQQGSGTPGTRQEPGSGGAEPQESPMQAWTAVERGAADFLQPGGAAEGLEQACTSLTRSVRTVGEAAVVRPLLELHQGAPRGQVLRSVVSGIPMCVLQPAIGVTSAATTALRGVRNSVDPSRGREAVQKYKGPE